MKSKIQIITTGPYSGFFKQSFPSKKIGIFSTWKDNRTKLVGEDLPQTDKIHFDYVFDKYELDTLNYPQDKKSRYIHLIDEKVSRKQRLRKTKCARPKLGLPGVY